MEIKTYSSKDIIKLLEKEFDERFDIGVIHVATKKDLIEGEDYIVSSRGNSKVFVFYESSIPKLIKNREDVQSNSREWWCDYNKMSHKGGVNGVGGLPTQRISPRRSYRNVR